MQKSAWRTIWADLAVIHCCQYAVTSAGQVRQSERGSAELNWAESTEFWRGVEDLAQPHAVVTKLRKDKFNMLRKERRVAQRDLS